MTVETCVDQTGRCSLCADEGRVGEVVEVLAGGLARVELPGGIEEVALDLLDGVAPGDRLVVHLGFALARVAEAR